MKRPILSVFCAALAAGCAHRPLPQPVVVPATPGPALSGDSLDAVRYPAVYKAYSLGRRIDPQNPRIMYEAGRIIVREYPDLWNLHPHQNTTVPMGPNVAPTNAAYSPLPLTDELKLELSVQKQATKAVQDQAVQLGRAVNDLAPVAKRMAEQQQQVLRHLLTTDERLRLLEERLRQTNAPAAQGTNSTNRASEPW